MTFLMRLKIIILVWSTWNLSQRNEPNLSTYLNWMATSDIGLHLFLFFVKYFFTYKKKMKYTDHPWNFELIYKAPLTFEILQWPPLRFVFNADVSWRLKNYTYLSYFLKLLTDSLIVNRSLVRLIVHPWRQLNSSYYIPYKEVDWMTPKK